MDILYYNYNILMKKYIILTIILISLFSLFGFLFWKNIEGFNEFITMYVISLKHDDRIKNIKKQESKINYPISIFDAVKGDKLDMNQLIKDGIVDKKFINADKQKYRVVGCYMSHLNLLKQLNENDSSGYSIIFEDDFDIATSTFLKEVNEIIEKLESKKEEFDIVLLGNLNENKGEQIIDNIYKINPQQNLWGTHGYIVNHSKIDKIIQHIRMIDMPIDNKYETLGKSNQLKIFVINPTIVNQLQEMSSTINDLTIETFTS
jgi:GR25 family glycosyltransferase involved in LPS biosynthesis